MNNRIICLKLNVLGKYLSRSSSIEVACILRCFSFTDKPQRTSRGVATPNAGKLYQTLSDIQSVSV